MDIIDQAQLQQETVEALHLKHRKQPEPLPVTGRCHNCEAQVPPNAVFCDSACAEDYEYVNKRRR